LIGATMTFFPQLPGLSFLFLIQTAPDELRSGADLTILWRHRIGFAGNAAADAMRSIDSIRCTYTLNVRIAPPILG
jgi:hypothetical protein